MLDNPLPWPGSARCAVAFSWDMDADSGLNFYNPDRADTLVASQSQTRYGPLIAVPRLVRLLKRYDMRHSFFVPGWCIEQYPAAIDALLEGGQEVALHGYIHERPNELPPEDERYWLERAVEAYRKRIGRKPAGWRAPSFAFSRASLEYLIAAGLEYDSSLMGDDVPYLLRHTTGDLIELPTEWALDDWPHYMHNRDFRHQMPISAPAGACEVYRAEFESAWRHGALLVTVWHPFLSGRLARLDAIVDLIEHMRAKGSVWFAPLADVARHAKELMAKGAWQPRIEHLPLYDSPVPGLTRAMR